MGLGGVIEDYYLRLLPHVKSPVNHTLPKKTQPSAMIVNSTHLTSVSWEKCTYGAADVKDLVE